ncbi:hypothetical protein B9479_000093 [Cryptococcus floricola]|uniref:ERCC1-like central domain-containing protein n=1 Tax=Cryptococcus floricola TaxID=2591691 RepID=A0A5D3B8E6_9TREE|nr:hypothetical protein B9479_000093 [Cryptococcus floricola]
MSNPGRPTGDSAMGPPAFQSATSVLKSTETLAAPSFRNASGGQPQVRDSEDSSSDTQPEGGPSAPPVQPQAGSSRPINRPASSKSSIVYNSVQRRNPVLGAMRSVGIEIGDIPADYQVPSNEQCSLKYHRLHPEYIHQRIEKMKNMYNLRIILVLCDVNEHHQSLRELSKIAIINDFTVFVAWSNEEIAQYLVTFKQFEHKSADMLKERVQQTYHDQLQHVLTSGKKVNKTDADNLAAEFGSLDNMSRKSAKALSNVKGLGATKVTSLVDAFNKPFLVGGLKRPERRQQGREESIYVGSSPDPSVAQDGVNGADGEMDEAVVWRDPLDDDDEEEAPSPKRTRVDDV